jgi:hypothetical protein
MHLRPRGGRMKIIIPNVEFAEEKDRDKLRDWLENNKWYFEEAEE